MGKFSDKLKLLAGELAKNEEKVKFNHTIRNLIAFYGVKGGLGTSTILANVATILAANKFRVCVVDFDVHFPTQFRLLMRNKDKSKVRSFKEMFINSSLIVTEVLNDTMISGLNLVTSAPEDQQTSYFELSDIRLKEILKDLSQMFDYVLIDIGGVDFAYETLMSTFSVSEQVYTIVSPNAEIIEGTYKAFQFLQEFKYYNGSRNIIQNLVLEDKIKESEFKGWGFNLLLDLPYYSDILKLRYNDSIIMRSDLEGPSAKLWRDGMLALASYIYKQSDASNYGMSDAESKIDLGNIEQGSTAVEEDSVLEQDVISEQDIDESSHEAQDDSEVKDLEEIDWSKYVGG